MFYDSNTVLIILSISLQIILVFERGFSRICKSSCCDCFRFENFAPKDGRRRDDY